MNNQIYVNWGGNQVSLRWHPYKNINQSEIVTSVHSYCFSQGKVLLVQVKERGFNIPGGHVEFNETPDEALCREAYEEGYVSGEIKYIGAIEVNHKDNPNFEQNGPYPLIGYQLFYRMDVEKCFPFLRVNETTSRIWVEPEEVPYVMNDHEISLLILKEALKIDNT
ncbi:NUDIX domain-containing protein [Psychrobacillus glaciei]|uniref:NUDIX domain-containing protein n=1 Tax=Psychrobacillus glaciei TaxID=2283160 RepID=A0A5J6SMF6_9BACI|nr:NUDIX domain-containing protein [Psychrobacillus glaciei]QFF99121.1 NUDIX domain-containing protein [Psychrobacillus glaciei]